MGDVNTSYVSDHQAWMNEQLAKNPEWVEDQKVGRALWWDKKQDVDTSTRNAASKLPMKSYPYDVNFSANNSPNFQSSKKPVIDRLFVCLHAGPAGALAIRA
jgi:hypothetical protein